MTNDTNNNFARANPIEFVINFASDYTIKQDDYILIQFEDSGESSGGGASRHFLLSHLQFVVGHNSPLASIGGDPYIQPIYGKKINYRIEVEYTDF